MILNCFKKYHYFIAYPINKISYEEGKSIEPIIDSEVKTFIERYFWWRNEKIEYYEPYTTKEDFNTFLIFGTAPTIGGKIDRNVLIFLLELYAQIQEPNKFTVTQQFSVKYKEVNKVPLLIYKIKKAKKNVVKPKHI